MTLTTIQDHTPTEFSREKLDLLKATICKGSTDEEFQLFVHACKRTGLDPFMKQVYAVKRWDSKLKRESMTIQTGIDGYRLIADRTGLYAPGKESTFTYDNNGRLLSATAYVKKQTRDGTWHEISCSAFYSEYCQKTKEGNPTSMWNNMPHVMLSKVAESLALRKAFPAELSGVYTSDEMQQAEVHEIKVDSKQMHAEAPVKKITSEQAKELTDLMKETTFEFQEKIYEFMKSSNINTFADFSIKLFENVYPRAIADRDNKPKEQIQDMVEE